MRYYYYAIIFILFLAIDASSQNTILWKIEHPNTKKTSYILGTYHQFGNSFVDSIPIIEESLLKSDVIIFESIDSKQELIKQMNDRECTNEIADILNKKELKTLSDLSKNWKVDICKLSPQEIYIKLHQELPKIICNTVQPADTWHHFDNYLMSIAKANDKEMIGLESTSFQLNTVNKVDVSSNKKHEQKRIRNLLKKISNNKPNDELCTQANNYRNFKIDYHFDKKCPEGIILKGRNANWMKKLPHLLKENNCFIAVGLGHLMMQCGLIVSLRDEGFNIEPIKINK